MKMRMKRFASFVLVMLMVLTMLGTVAFAQDPITVTVRVQGYNNSTGGEIINEYNVTLNDNTGFTAYDALVKACNDNNKAYVASGSGAGVYVSAIDGQAEMHFLPNQDYYSGWMYRVWKNSDQPGSPQEDVLPSVSAGSYDLEANDKVAWYYAIPAMSWYTLMDNYDSIEDSYNEGSSISINVKGQKFTDVWNWNMTDFEDLSGATVAIVRASDNQELAAGITGIDGSVDITAPNVNADTDCYIYVKNKFITSGGAADGLENVKSWTKPITIINQ